MLFGRKLNMLNITLNRLPIAWVQVIAIALVQISITLTWIIYNAYLPKLLVSYGFPESFTVTILVIENMLAVVMEPLMGKLSDRSLRWVSTKLGFISIGIILSATIFILIPTFLLFRGLLGSFTIIFPAILIAWALAMTVFRSPVISLLGRYSTPEYLPLATSIIVFVSSFLGAFRPIITKYILSLGAPITFALGSFTLLGGALVLKLVNPPEISQTEPHHQERLNWWKLLLVLLMGTAIAWGSRWLMESLPKFLKLTFDLGDITTIMLIINLTIAGLAIPAGLLSSKFNSHRLLLTGSIGCLMALLLMVNLPIPLVLAIAVLLIVLSINLVNSGVIPLALSVVNNQQQGLGVGMYFGGFSAGMSSFSYLFPPSASIDLKTGGIVGVIAYLCATLLIWLIPKID
jgi:MFS family permease